MTEGKPKASASQIAALVDKRIANALEKVAESLGSAYGTAVVEKALRTVAKELSNG